MTSMQLKTEIHTTSPFTPMSFFMLDFTLQEAEEMLAKSKLLTSEQKKAALEEYRLMLID